MEIYRYIIILFLVLVSCNTTKNIIKNNDIRDRDLSVNNSDTTKLTISKGIDIDEEEIKVIVGQGIDVGHSNPKKVPTTKHKSNKSNVSPISDSISSKSDGGLIKGLIAYSVPKEMTVGYDHTIKVRISKEKDVTKIIVGDRGIVIADTNTSSVFVETIRVEPVMSAELMAEKNAFDVDTLSTNIQNIDDYGYTEWAWNVKPLKAGENYLRLIVRVRTNTSQGYFYKDITVFDKNIKVKSNIVFSITRWISEYWQWLITSIISPLIVWWYNNRKKKKKKKLSQ